MSHDSTRVLKAAEVVAASFSKTTALPSYLRAEILQKISKNIEQEAEAFAKLICQEVKKPIKEARREVSRAVFTFSWAGEEAKRFGGEILPLDLDGSAVGRLALTRRFPRGPALLISPFNFPLNLVAHKIAPAIAIGAPFILKPAPQAPKTALKLLQIIRQSGWPEDAGEVLLCSNEEAESLVQSEFFQVLSFTGSAAVGWRLKSLAGKKRVILELGGNAPLFISSDADLERSAQRACWGAFYYSGQVCISVQRILVEAPRYEKFKESFLSNMAALKIGNPEWEATDIAPLIDSKAADRVEEWIKEAQAGGARVLFGGKREGDIIAPTLIENAPRNCRLSCQEAFGPVALIEKVETPQEALKIMASGSYGLQAGIFTHDMRLIDQAFRELPFGGVIINDIPSFRSDAAPYGGVKDSGIGREGARYAMEEYSEIKTLILNP